MSAVRFGEVREKERIYKAVCSAWAKRGHKPLSLSLYVSVSLSFSSLAVAAVEASGGMLRLQFFRLGRKKRSCRARWRHQGLCARPDRHQQRSLFRSFARPFAYRKAKKSAFSPARGAHQFALSFYYGEELMQIGPIWQLVFRNKLKSYLSV